MPRSPWRSTSSAQQSNWTNAPEPSARRVRRVVTESGLHAFEAVYEPVAQLPEHGHAAPFFTYVLDGSYVERAGRQEPVCSRGTVIFHDHESHTNEVGRDGTASLNVELDPELWRDSPAPDRASPRPPAASSVATSSGRRCASGARSTSQTRPPCSASKKHPSFCSAPLAPLTHAASSSRTRASIAASSICARTRRLRIGLPRSRVLPTSTPCTWRSSSDAGSDVRWGNSCGGGGRPESSAASR